MVDGSVLSLVKKQTNRPGKTHKKVSGFLVVEPRPRWLIFYSSIFSFFLLGGFYHPSLLSGPTTQKTSYFLCVFPLGKPQKKNPPLMARPLRPSPPPSSLLAIGTFFFYFFFSLKIAKNGF